MPTLIPQAPAAKSLGIAWDVRGTWHQGSATKSIRTADAIEPGALLLPDPTASAHSITLLLPDGQRVLYECFTVGDCARGFRAPELYKTPDSFASGLIARIRAELSPGGEPPSSGDAASTLPQDEVVALVGPGNTVNIGGLASSLPNGTYSCAPQLVSDRESRPQKVTVQKTTRALDLPVPKPGLYAITIVDASNRPRINLLLAAITSQQNATVMQPFTQARALFKDWNEDYMGWPVHTFQRAYLRSLVLGIQPRPATQPHAGDPQRPGVALEPRFSPAPGVFKGDTRVQLRSSTPGSSIHYTVDGSQPFLSSPVYAGPINVKGTELTIKAFASAPGKKDSPVVTGIFRIEQ